MKIFLSWSGARSNFLAQALRGWLPRVIQSVKPWMSDEDISAGSRWLNEVSSELSESKLGIICVTPENQSNPWLLFEAGALSKTLEQTHVCPFLFKLTPGQDRSPNFKQMRSIVKEPIKSSLH
jgi:TIR domain